MVGLKQKLEHQEGMASLTQGHTTAQGCLLWPSSPQGRVPEFIKVHSASWEPKQKFRYYSRDKVTIKKIILIPKDKSLMRELVYLGTEGSLNK